MLTFKTYLTELFNNPYKWRWTRKNRVVQIATFFTKDGTKIRFHAGIVSREKDSYELGFDAQSPSGDSDPTLLATNAGDAFRILATIIEITRDWIQRKNMFNEPVEMIRFTAEKEAEDPRGRAAVYHRFAKALSKEIGFEYVKSDDDSEVVFTLRKKD